MNDKILHESYSEIVEDTKLITLATATTIFHSLIFILYILYQVYSIITKMQWWSMHFDIIQDYIRYIFWNEQFIYIFITIAIILWIWYFLLPPIAESSLISYLSSSDKSRWRALVKWFWNFFQMFELDSILSVFNFFIFLIIASRAYVIWILDNPFVIAVMSIWFCVIIWISITTPYAKFLIVLEWKDIKDAIMESVKMSFENFSITAKFVLIKYLLYIRIIINILLIIWIPFLFIYLMAKFDIWKNIYIKSITYFIIFSLLSITVYINWIVEAFFISYWYKIYNSIKPKIEEKTE